MTTTIQLDQFLKLMGAATTGGAAKVMIQAGEVWVNDSIETRRGRKLSNGDQVKVGEETFTVAL
ncbi:RNA-binding S4 domain-containing protein [Candidatus Cyanaurora vandensis]|uniref:RNA-binding S4 domain-containing protein n=1 Tax=Candidatus Cyanaurora vandensis TaxID=2714958 RepID=UPI00257EC391|nr:RNA-binding S4 domain-containing protein [Candidatus Cyanaurora vandensis]